MLGLSNLDFLEPKSQCDQARVHATPEKYLGNPLKQISLICVVLSQ
jgi:hypothetical protein